MKMRKSECVSLSVSITHKILSLSSTTFTTILLTILTFLLLIHIILQNYKSTCYDECCDNLVKSCPLCEPIDVVYTWVNGSDPLLLQDMKKYSQAHTEEDDLMPSRYDDKQELRYSLRSLEKYANWIRNVYIVTADQIPWWLDVRNQHIHLVSHEDIIPKEYLPTFSSPTIEYFLYRIPGLSRRFLYFNDDVFLGNPLHLSDLFTESEGYHVYTSWNVPDCAPGCPWSFLGDSSCDNICNISECDHDGGDCVGGSNRPRKTDVNHLDYLGDYDDNAFFDDVEKDDYSDRFIQYPPVDAVPLQERQNQDRELLSAIINKPDTEDTKDYPDAHSRSLKSLRSNILKTADEIKAKAFIKRSQRNLIAKIEKMKHKNISEEVESFNKKVLHIDKKLRKVDEVENKTEAKIDNRKLDMYAKSLIHTNKIFNRAYGFQNRKVPAHTPLLLDKDIITNMRVRFKDEIETTVKNKFRRANDFQFAFAYFHYLMSEKREMTIEEIFDLYDTDKSGTWSDREVRTVLARIRGLPITAAAVTSFEAAAKTCDKEEYRNHPTPPNERYLDSDMPTLSRDLICGCSPLRGPLRAAQLPISDHHGHPKSAVSQATFAMLSSNITKSVAVLDEIRRETKKFICINDNLDPSREEENVLVRMLLQELYEGLLPIPSQFELPHGVANRFLRISELKEWKTNRETAWSALVCCIILLMGISIWQSRCCRYRNLKTYCSLKGYL